MPVILLMDLVISSPKKNINLASLGWSASDGHRLGVVQYIPRYIYIYTHTISLIFFFLLHFCFHEGPLLYGICNNMWFYDYIPFFKILPLSLILIGYLMSFICLKIYQLSQLISSTFFLIYQNFQSIKVINK